MAPFIPQPRVAAVLLTLIGFILARPAGAQDPAAGKRLFEKCLACHTIGPGARPRNGPSLDGVLGRKAGSAEGFSYSTGLKDAGSGGLVWTEATLDKYLADPVGFVPRSKMAWAVRDEGQRRDLIAYIKTLR